MFSEQHNKSVILRCFIMNEITKQKIGNRINAALALRNVKQKELAKAIGVSDNVISFYCSGNRTPNCEQLIEIAKYLDVSTDYLLGLTENMTAKKDIDYICNYVGLSEKAVDLLHQGKEKEIADYLNSVISSACESTYVFNLFRDLLYYLKSEKIDVRSGDDYMTPFDLMDDDFDLDEYEPIKTLLYVLTETPKDQTIQNIGMQYVKSDFWESYFLMSAQQSLAKLKNDLSHKVSK